IVNIGGIANVTLMPAAGQVTGYDTGPGNTLLDRWCAQHLGKPYDDDGTWAASGETDDALLETLLTDNYFAMDPPKSTGREYFNQEWLQRYLNSVDEERQPADVQATLAELTAVTVSRAVQNSAADSEVYLCGGGARNADLLQRLSRHLAPLPVATTGTLGIEPDWVEAAAFAWLARARLHSEPGNIPSVTGASRPAVLGALHAP
ncbi:MAG: anhydro-N-acetylmuramic acid kinase, partial [Gammaproteobacteria bacterium]|nr:anhydro-N-acetylmuramic acid kinase [Gammaproteobacteria bacterium]